MPKALFTRASHDLASEYLAAFGKLLVDYATAQGYTVVDLYAEDARLVKFEAEMNASPPPDVVCCFGHANENSQRGQDLEVLLQVGMNDQLMSGKKADLMSCLSAVQLGPSMVQKGCPVYLGYSGDLTFVYDPDYESDPLNDPYAKGFFDCCLATGYALILGKTPKEIYDLTLQRYDFWWDYWYKSSDPLSDDCMTWLNWNKTHFTALTPTETEKMAPAQPQLSSLLIPLGVAGFLLLLTQI
jgi:hypothetical protein